MTSATKMINDTATGINIPAFVDAWGNPLVFCRWPIGNPNPNPPTQPGSSFVSLINPGGAQPGFNDPLDPRGMLTGDSSVSGGWLGVPPTFTTSSTTFQQLCHPLPGRVLQSAYSVNLTPVIVSCGQDGNLGLFYDPNDPNYNPANYNGPGFPFFFPIPGSSAASDNIYSTYNN
jgi:hypothetical protein